MESTSKISSLLLQVLLIESKPLKNQRNPRKVIPTPTPVIPGLYLTSENITLERDLLLRMKITHILSVGAGPRQGHHPGVFEHLRIGIKDAIASDLLQILPKCLEFIQQGMEKGNVVVHCKAGRSRSASVVMAYLI